MALPALKNFRVTWDTAGVVTAALDVPGRTYNVFTEQVLAELQSLVAELEHDATVRLVIFRSDKESGFLAGGDLREISAIRSWQTADQIVIAGQKLFDRLSGLPMPTVAVIHGPCLGGGLELALACRYRVARDDESTRLGLPEAKLGLLPALGRHSTPAGIGGPEGCAADALDGPKAVAARGCRDWPGGLRSAPRGVCRRRGAVRRRSALGTTVAAAASEPRGATPRSNAAWARASAAGGAWAARRSWPASPVDNGNLGSRRARAPPRTRGGPGMGTRRVCRIAVQPVQPAANRTIFAAPASPQARPVGRRPDDRRGIAPDGAAVSAHDALIFPQARIGLRGPSSIGKWIAPPADCWRWGFGGATTSAYGRRIGRSGWCCSSPRRGSA